MLTELFPATEFLSRLQMFSGCQCHLVRSKCMLLTAFPISKQQMREQRGKHPSFKFCFGHWLSNPIFSGTTCSPDFARSKWEFYVYFHSISKGWFLEVWTTVTECLSLCSGTARYKRALCFERISLWMICGGKGQQKKHQHQVFRILSPFE